MIKHDEIRDALMRRLERLGISANLASKRIGISNAVLSNVINEAWKEKPELTLSNRMWNKIAQWAGYGSSWNIVETTDFTRIQNICKHAQQEGISRAISDAQGRGKSIGLATYAASNPNVFYLECEVYYTKKVFLQELIQKMGLEVSGNVPVMMNAIIEQLNSIDDPLVIIDQADKLPDAALNLYIALYNKCSCGFILCGTRRLSIIIEKGKRLNKIGFAELFSRIGGMFINLHGVNETAITQICQANEISVQEDINEVIKYAEGDLRRVKAAIDNLLLRNKNSKE